ncbi:hypothetical protein ACFX11_038133 [Malus domestica]
MLPYLPYYADVLHTINHPELLNIPSGFITKQKKKPRSIHAKHQSAIFSGSVTTSSAKTCLVRSQIGGEEELAESVDGVEVGTTGLVEIEVEKGVRKRTPKFANQNGTQPLPQLIQFNGDLTALTDAADLTETKEGVEYAKPYLLGDSELEFLNLDFDKSGIPLVQQLLQVVDGVCEVAQPLADEDILQLSPLCVLQQRLDFTEDGGQLGVSLFYKSVGEVSEIGRGSAPPVNVGAREHVEIGDLEGAIIDYLNGAAELMLEHFEFGFRVDEGTGLGATRIGMAECEEEREKNQGQQARVRTLNAIVFRTERVCSYRD